MSDKNQTAKPAQNAVALSTSRRGTARFDLASLFDEVPAPVAAQKSLTRNESKIVVLARSVRRLAPAA